MGLIRAIKSFYYRKKKRDSREERRRKIKAMWHYINHDPSTIDLGLELDEKIKVFIGRDGEAHYKIIKYRRRKKRR